MPLRLDTPVQYLKGVGPHRAETFARLGIHTVEHLLYHIPHRYLDATTVTQIARADVGKEVTLVGRVVSTGVLPTRRRLRIFRAVIRDASGLIECAWPGQTFLDRTIKEGQLLLVSGPIKHYHGRQMVPREQVILAGPDDSDDEDADKGLVLPVYPATEGLSHRQIRRLIKNHLEEFVALVDDVVRASVPKDLNLPSLSEALLAVHRPATTSQAEQGRRRLAFDELFDMQPLELPGQQVLQALDDRDHADDRRHTDDDAERRQQRAHLVGPQGAEGDAEVLGKDHRVIRRSSTTLPSRSTT